MIFIRTDDPGTLAQQDWSATRRQADHFSRFLKGPALKSQKKHEMALQREIQWWVVERWTVKTGGIIRLVPESFYRQDQVDSCSAEEGSGTSPICCIIRCLRGARMTDHSLRPYQCNLSTHSCRIKIDDGASYQVNSVCCDNESTCKSFRGGWGILLINW